jgi:hypothetical protein
MNKLAAVEAQSDGRGHADADAGRIFARVRVMMIISGLTTLIAIAAVVGAIGYRVYHAGGSAGGTFMQGVVTLPKGARVIASSIAENRLVVTLDIAGATELRTYDLKTLKETGRIRFATEP